MFVVGSIFFIIGWLVCCAVVKGKIEDYKTYIFTLESELRKCRMGAKNHE